MAKRGGDDIRGFFGVKVPSGARKVGAAGASTEGATAAGPEDWACKSCTFRNPASQRGWCGMCGSIASQVSNARAATTATASGGEVQAARAMRAVVEAGALLSTAATLSFPARAAVPAALTARSGPCPVRNAEATALAAVLASEVQRAVAPTFLTSDGSSWYILVPRYWPAPSKEAFDEQWQFHPTEFHELTMFGKKVKESRWSLSWGRSYKYSGSVNAGRPLCQSPMARSLIDRANALYAAAAASLQASATSAAAPSSLSSSPSAPESSVPVAAPGCAPVAGPFNACLQNFYLPEHKIGLHADDESALVKGLPIFSLSWGGSRRFLLRRIQPTGMHASPASVSAKLRGAAPGSALTSALPEVVDLILKDGDLLVMGGTCQQTHKHEVPGLRKTMDGPTANRVNWTVRAFA